MAEEEPGYSFEVIIERDEDGGYIAEVPSLPGCHTQGDSPEELKKNIKEAILLYIETIGARIPPEYLERQINQISI